MSSLAFTVRPSSSFYANNQVSSDASYPTQEVMDSSSAAIDTLGGGEPLSSTRPANAVLLGQVPPFDTGLTEDMNTVTGGRGVPDELPPSQNGLATQPPADLGDEGSLPVTRPQPSGQARGSVAPAVLPPDRRGGSVAGPGSPDSLRASGEASTSDGYTVTRAVNDMLKLQAGDRKEGGTKRSAAELRPIAEGIVRGVNAYFPAAVYGSPTHMAQTLVAAAWKESKFDTNLGNGGVFQCAKNRLDDYNKMHGTHVPHSALSTKGDPAQAIDVSLWAMAHPNPGVVGKPVGGTPIPGAFNEAALYYWNYNGSEIADYMTKTRYFESIMAR